MHKRYREELDDQSTNDSPCRHVRALRSCWSRRYELFCLGIDYQRGNSSMVTLDEIEKKIEELTKRKEQWEMERRNSAVYQKILREAIERNPFHERR